ncbi:MAG: ribonuclease J [Bauldia sp.]|nr:ribonuclease J [Bauldia sp.]
MATDELVFVALGGVGEIGMNLGVYGYGPPQKRQWLAVDCGIAFAGPELPGIEVIYPDPAFLEREKSRLLGIVITHAHEDHYGALPAIWPRLGAPVFASPFTAGLIEAKRESEHDYPDFPVSLVRPGDRRTIGPFEVEFIAVTHSIPEPMALAIHTPLGTVVHTGDWKFDDAPLIGPSTDKDRLRALGDEGVLALVCDSTNAVRPGRSPSEGAVADELKALVAESTGRVAFTLFASNVARLQSIARAANAAGREVVVAGRALWRAIEVSTELGYLDGLRFHEAGILNELPADNVVLVLSGSQGESRAALARIAAQEHPQVRLSRGDRVVFSSRAIPGNERAIYDIMNRLVAQGIDVVTDHDRLVHVSGHPRRDELAELYDLVRPRIVVPVHGEATHLAAQRELARASGVSMVLDAPNGTLARLAPQPGTQPNATPVGRLYRDGTVVGPAEELGVAERRRMAFGGHIVVAINLDGRGEVVGEFEYDLLGIPERGPDGKSMSSLVERAVAGALSGIPRPRRRDPDLVSEAVRRAVRGEVATVWGKKPVCTVLVAVV